MGRPANYGTFSFIQSRDEDLKGRNSHEKVSESLQKCIKTQFSFIFPVFVGKAKF